MKKSAAVHVLLLDLAGRNEELRACYRESLRYVQAPALVRMTQSVIDQKSVQSEKLRVAAGYAPSTSFEYEEPDTTPPVATNADELLKLMIDTETRLSTLFRSMVPVVADREDALFEINAAADMSVKFATWARDHKELLALF